MVVVVFVLAYVAASFYTHRFSQEISTHTVWLGDKSISVELARTPNERERGLMDRESLPQNSGMLFVFPIAASHTFWNQRTLIPLDLIWIHGDKVVGVSQLPRVQDRGIVEVSSPEPADLVLEVNAGWAHENNVGAGTAFRQ